MDSYNLEGFGVIEIVYNSVYHNTIRSLVKACTDVTADVVGFYYKSEKQDQIPSLIGQTTPSRYTLILYDVFADVSVTNVNVYWEDIVSDPNVVECRVKQLCSSIDEKQRRSIESTFRMIVFSLIKQRSSQTSFSVKEKIKKEFRNLLKYMYGEDIDICTGYSRVNNIIISLQNTEGSFATPFNLCDSKMIGIEHVVSFSDGDKVENVQPSDKKKPQNSETKRGITYLDRYLQTISTDLPRQDALPKRKEIANRAVPTDSSYVNVNRNGQSGRSKPGNPDFNSEKIYGTYLCTHELYNFLFEVLGDLMYKRADIRESILKHWTHANRKDDMPYSISKKDQDISRFVSEKEAFTPFCDPSSEIDTVDVIKTLHSLLTQLTINVNERNYKSSNEILETIDSYMEQFADLDSIPPLMTRGKTIEIDAEISVLRDSLVDTLHRLKSEAVPVITLDRIIAPIERLCHLTNIDFPLDDVLNPLSSLKTLTSGLSYQALVVMNPLESREVTVGSKKWDEFNVDLTGLNQDRDRVVEDVQPSSSVAAPGTSSRLRIVLETNGIKILPTENPNLKELDTKTLEEILFHLSSVDKTERRFNPMRTMITYELASRRNLSK